MREIILVEIYGNLVSLVFPWAVPHDETTSLLFVDFYDRFALLSRDPL